MKKINLGQHFSLVLYSKMQEDIQEESIKRAMEAKDKATQKANLENANMAREAIKKNTSLVFELQEKLKCVLSKKPIGN